MGSHPLFLLYPSIREGDLSSPARLREIYESDAHYYLSEDWSPGHYIALARAGFISVSIDPRRFGGPENQDLLLLAEIQTHYAILDWKNLHVGRSMRRWMRKDACTGQEYTLKTGGYLPEILEGLQRAHPTNWMRGTYAALVQLLADGGPRDDFELIPVALVNREGKVAAGEIGYRIGSVFTSLCGFFDRSDPVFTNTGKLQLILLAEHLRSRGYAFWNLGHPWMQYKIDLGARVLTRERFLQRWLPKAWPEALEMLR